ATNAGGGNSVDVPVFLAGSDEYATIDDLVAALQGAINTALDNSALGTHDTKPDGTPGTDGVDDIMVCRPVDDPNVTGADACAGTGNRLFLRGEQGAVTNLSIDVPLNLDLGDNVGAPNGMVTMLGYAPTSGENHRARASRFFLDNVHLSGTFDLVVS